MKKRNKCGVHCKFTVFLREFCTEKKSRDGERGCLNFHRFEMSLVLSSYQLMSQDFLATENSDLNCLATRYGTGINCRRLKTFTVPVKTLQQELKNRDRLLAK